MAKSKSFPILAGAAIGAAFLAAAIPQARAANIITFGDAPGTCSSNAVMCSTNGTTGYLNNGTGVAFDLSTINRWFQIDVDGMSHLAGQPVEPAGGAGGFLVVNDTGAAVTSFSLTLNDTFTTSTGCTISGTNCNNFQANKPDGTYSPTSEALSGPLFFSCTNGSAMGGFPCESTAGQAAANFSTPGTVTYTWNLDIPAGDKFDITFASWTSGNTFAVPAPVIGHGLLVLLAVGGVLSGGKLLESFKKRHPHAA